jgi:hypothetical protein
MPGPIATCGECWVTIGWGKTAKMAKAATVFDTRMRTFVARLVVGGGLAPVPLKRHALSTPLYRAPANGHA